VENFEPMDDGENENEGERARGMERLGIEDIGRERVDEHSDEEDDEGGYVEIDVDVDTDADTDADADGDNESDSDDDNDDDDDDGDNDKHGIAEGADQPELIIFDEQ
jgi:hypothetical protein